MDPSAESELKNREGELPRAAGLGGSGGTARITPTGDLEPQQRMGRYVLLERIATGGMAEVYLARHDGPHGFSKTLVVKRILPHLAKDPQFLKMFLDEARVAALLEHPNLVSVQEAGTEPDYFIAMEHLDGPNLLKLGRTAGRDPRNFKFWARIIADACSGLDYAHALRGAGGEPLNIVHRDVSLENIVVTYDGRVKVLDFGIAKADCIEGWTAPGHVKGKFAYLAPEQFLGASVDRRADIWALGVCLYRLLAGVRPFAGANMAEMMQRVISQDPPPLHSISPEVPEELSRIAHRALRKRPEHRYASAQEMQDDLLAWLRSHGGVTSRDLAHFVEGHVPRSARIRDAREPSPAPLPPDPPLSEDIHLGWADASSASEVAPPAPDRPSVRVSHRLAAWGAETVVVLIALGSTRAAHFPWAFALLVLASLWTLARWRATPGEWLFGLTLRPANGDDRIVLRGLLRLVIQYAWLGMFAWFLHAAGSPLAQGMTSTLIGIGSLGCFLASAIGSIPATFGDRQTLHDKASGLEVVRVGD